MSIDIRLKHSAVNGKAPQPSDLSDGELALNINDADPAIYLKDSAGAVRRMDAGAVPAATATTVGTVQLADAAAVAAGTAGRVVDAAQLKAAVAVENLWDRTGTTLSPATAGDDVDLGTGDLSAAAGTFSGDVVVTGTASFQGNAVNVDSSGKLLVGTASSSTASSAQQAILQVQGSSASSTGGGIFSINLGNSGNALVNNNYVGGLYYASTAGEFASIECRADGTCGAGDYPGRLAFGTTASGASATTERVTIDSAGTTTFHSGASGFSKYIEWADACLYSTAAGIAAANHIRFKNANGQVGRIYTDGSSTVYATGSDYRLKENVAPVTDGIARLQQLKPSRFNFIADPGTTVDGFIAHEVQGIVPEAVGGDKDAVNENGDPEYQSIDQSKLVPLLTAALQEAITRIEALEAEVQALKAK